MHTTQDSQKTHRGEGKDFVTVTVDNQPKAIQRGSYAGAKLKQALEVDDCKELDQLIDGQLKPIADDSHVVIKGGEKFVSHHKSGGSS